MAIVKVRGNNVDANGENFSNFSPQTIFSFGTFSVTSNFDGKTPIDYTNQLSSFVQPITLENINLSEAQSEILYEKNINATPNLNKSDLKTFVRFGSAYEFLRISIENIIVNYPASIFINSQIDGFSSVTFSAFTYNTLTNISKFKIPLNNIENNFGLILDRGNNSIIEGNELRNLNLSYSDYIVWSPQTPDNSSIRIIGFTGFSNNNNTLTIETLGNPFPNTSGSAGTLNYHLKPNNYKFEEYRELLKPYERYILSERNGTSGFKFKIKNPTLLDNGTITYSDINLSWPTSDGYNVDINTTSSYRNFLDNLLTIGAKYDTVKTDLIARFLTPASIKTYDLTEEGKVTKLLKIFGWEFDQLREFIDSLTYVNKVSYDKINNVPDQLVQNLAKTFGWDYFSLVNEKELVETFLTVDDNERNLNTDLLPPEIDIELWRRILNNTNYYWKSKGTREAIKSIFLLIGIPEPFINITEYVYTVDGRIDPRTVTLTETDFPSNSLPYDSEGYPIAPLETNDFYFQVSGDSDSGQAYMDVFRQAGFTLNRTVDNKKVWAQTGSTTRRHYSTPQYFQQDSKLVLNTKEVDISLDVARGIEYDVYRYIKDQDFPANSSGYTLPFSYVNVSLGYAGTTNVFTLPSQFGDAEGKLEVRFNGVLLNAPNEYDGITINDELSEADYIISGNSFILTNGNYAINSGNRRDVIQATYVYSGGTEPITGISVQYIVTRIRVNLIGTSIPLPSVANGDVQVTINGVALTKGTNQFVADYIVNPNDSSEIIIQNPDIISYLAINPYVQVAYINVSGSTSISARSEVTRVDSLNNGKLYFNQSANKFVYRLNYRINSVSDVKILVDGIGLEPSVDYSLNTNNPYEIYLPRGIKFGSVVSAYYLVGGNDYFEPIINNDFGVGDISDLSFLEFIELVQRKMINATNRKIVSDYKGGWYPALLNIYVNYLNRSRLAETNPLKSNGYTFANLYTFLSKYNSFFQRFVDQILSATIILKRGGLLVRNSVFTKQKFAYKRGVNFDRNVNYFGNDGSVFLKRPLSQDVNWSSDYVCTSDLCEGFVVNNITIDFPYTTTTTTALPYGGIILFNETVSQQNISTTYNSGRYRKIELDVLFSPAILPSYSVDLRFNYVVNNEVTGATINDSIISSVKLIKNGVVETEDIYNTIGQFTGSSVVTITSGDILIIIVENTALIGLGGTLASAETILVPVVDNVTPNGGEFTLVPSEITNTIRSS